MALLIFCLVFMPYNPYSPNKRPVVIPRYPYLMNAGIKQAPQPFGEKKALVIIVDFADHQRIYDAAGFDSLIYGTGRNSLRDYYTEASYGKFTISKASKIGGWYRAPQSYSFYVGQEYGITDPYPHNAQGLVVAACSLADPYVDFADFDEDGDGVVDAIFVVHAGPGAEETGSTGDIWSHQWQLSNTNSGCPGAYATDDGVVVDHYSMEPERLQSYSAMITVGVFAHEFGHILGLPDLYDTDYSTYGIGDFCIMASGSWGRISSQDLPGSSPTHFCAWSKYQLGWLDPTAVERIGTPKFENQSIACSAKNAVAYRLLEDPNGPDWQSTGGQGEYFLVENRYQSGFDRSLPGDGLLILHCDDTRQDNDHEDHPLVAIMQADGDEDLLLDYGDHGKAADLWKNRTYGFGDTSRPASLDYNSNPTGVWVYDIGTADSVMTASLWVTPVLLGRVYSMPNPFVINKKPSWGDKVIITYVPSDTVELGLQFPEFKVTIYNIAGEKVRELNSIPDEVDPFARRAFWNLKTEKGHDAVSGMYIYIIETSGDKVERNKGRLTIIR
jgi:immune inhibitor A